MAVLSMTRPIAPELSATGYDLAVIVPALPHSPRLSLLGPKAWLFLQLIVDAVSVG